MTYKGLEMMVPLLFLHDSSRHTFYVSTIQYLREKYDETIILKAN